MKLETFETGKPKKEKPDEKLLINLLEACKNYEIEIIYDSINELTIYEYDNKNDNELISWLYDKGFSWATDEIIERLSTEREK
jgi:hypothetical protein